jgi:hypothetical protein
LIIFVTSSDYFRERSLHVVVGMGLGIIGIIVMATSTDPQLRYGFTHVCLAGVFVGGPLIAVWLAGNTPWKVQPLKSLQTDREGAADNLTGLSKRHIGHQRLE